MDCSPPDSSVLEKWLFLKPYLKQFLWRRWLNINILLSRPSSGANWKPFPQPPFSSAASEATQHSRPFKASQMIHPPQIPPASAHTDFFSPKSSSYPSPAAVGEPWGPVRNSLHVRFNPWVGKIPWRKAWQPTPVFLPGESPWTEEPVRLQSVRSQRVGHDWSDLAHTHTFLYKGHFLSLSSTVAFTQRNYKYPMSALKRTPDFQ